MRDAPDAEALSFVGWRGMTAAADQWSRRDIAGAAAAAAARITAETGRQDRVLIGLPPGPSFVAAFLGCLLAGRIAIPLPPPFGGRAAAHCRRVIEDAAPALAIVAEGADPGPVACCAPPLDRSFAIGPAARPTPDTPAYLQYTSGSTAAPKGVVVTHGMLAANIALIRDAWDLGPADRGGFWLPPWHDMGLVGGLLAPLAIGFPAALMHPAAFLQRPERWIALMSVTRASFGGAPDFAFALTAARAGQGFEGAYDLSAWRVAVDGAEPVRAATLDAFAEALAPHGFRREALAPGYGLAESVLFVTGSRPGRAPRTRTDGQVSCGAPGDGVDLRIVDPLTHLEAAAGAEGEIWIAGPSVAQRYWGGPVHPSPFGARLASDPQAGPYLRTGDLGRMVGGELLVSGRIKDVHIRAGRNIHLGDVEAVARASLGVSPALRVAALDCDGALIVFVECDADLTPASGAGALLAADLGQALDVVPDRLVPLRPGTIPVTTSGKIARADLRAAHLAGRLAVIPETTAMETAA